MPRRAAAATARDAVIITCEHGGNGIPAAYRRLFAGRDRLLASHRGYDPGALELARLFASRLGAPLSYSTTSRLLIDLNRSLDNPSLFSSITADLATDAQERIVRDEYLPYRREVEAAIRNALRRASRVIHISVHSFTPVLRGERRTADVGLLFDPARPAERAFCDRWRRTLLAADPALCIRHNYPYHGASDGHTTTLRGVFPPSRYVGVELEVNQRFPRTGGRRWERLQAALAESLCTALRPTAGTDRPDHTDLDDDQRRGLRPVSPRTRRTEQAGARRAPIS